MHTCNLISRNITTRKYLERLYLWNYGTVCMEGYRVSVMHADIRKVYSAVQWVQWESGKGTLRYGHGAVDLR